MSICWEVRATGRRTGTVNLVTADNLASYTGFRSVYGFPPETAEVIAANNSTADLGTYPLYSDTLFLDFDNNDKAAWEFADTTPYSYTMYETGGRGYHFHIPIVPMYGLGIPEAQKAWVTANCPQADVSIYKTSGVIRLPGTFHAKNPGKVKTVVTQQGGNLLHIPPYQPAIVPDVVSDTTDDNLDGILDTMLFKVVTEGTTGRNFHAFKLACVCRDLGYSLPETMDLVAGWNVNFCIPPLKPVEITNTCNSAFKKLLRK